ncbi:hypothetical protein OAN12_05475 [Halioglobus sp.]|nr:hypothetical protein [Halioglobus sp.]
MEQTNQGRMVLLLIAGIPLTMILAATWLWFFVARGELDIVGALGTANRGELIQPPRQLQDANLRELSGQKFAFSDLEPRWSMLIPGTGGYCDSDCEKSLYETRQIRVAIGKDVNRLRRVYISDTPSEYTQLSVTALSDGRAAPSSFADYLKEEHDNLHVLLLPGEEQRELFPEQSEDPTTWYLVDPAGWVMMAYDNQVPYKDVIADLKFLLKNSGG